METNYNTLIHVQYHNLIMEDVQFSRVLVFGSEDISNIIMFDSGNSNSHLVIKNFTISQMNINKSFFQIFGNETHVDIKKLTVTVYKNCYGSVFEFNSLKVNI